MSERTKNRWPNRLRHEAYGGDISGTFCGRAFKGIRTMVLNTCIKRLTRCGKNNLAR